MDACRIVPRPEDLGPEHQREIQAVAAAAEAAISKVTKNHFLSALGDNKTFGMSKPEFAQYSREVQKAQQAFVDKQVERTFKQLRKEKGPEWKEAVAQNHFKAENEVVARPDVAARQAIQYNEGPRGEPLETPPLKFSTRRTETNFGPAWKEQLPAAMFRAGADEAKGAMHPDDVAEMLGYDSGEKLLQDLVQLERERIAGGFKTSKDHLKGLIEERAHEMTRAEVGYDISPEWMRRDAEAQVGEPLITTLLSNQMHYLSQMVGLPIDMKAVHADAMRIFSELIAKDAAKPSKFIQTMQQLGRTVEVMLRKGDWKAAFIAKQQQYMNNLQYKMAKDFLTVRNRNKALWKDLASSREKTSIDQYFMDAIHAELQSFGYSVPHANLEYRRDLWTQATTDMGYSVIEGPTLPTAPRNWAPPKDSDIQFVDTLTVDQFTDLVNRMDNLIHLGKLAQEVIDGANHSAMNALVDEAVMNAANVRQIGIANTGVVKRNVLSGLNAELSQVQPLFDRLDDNNANGVFNRVLRQPAVEAHSAKLALRAEVHDLIRAEYNKFSNVEKAQWQRNIPAGHGLVNFLDGREVELKVGDVIGIALNLGTDLNRWHVEDGGWNWNNSQYMALLERHMTPKMMDFVDHLHGLMEHLWPKLAAEEFRETGLAPEKQQPTSFYIGSRRMNGGYWPLVKDPRAYLAGSSSPDVAALFKQKFIVPSTPAGFLKKRVGAQYPMTLDWQNVLFHHLNDITNRIAYNGFVSSAMRFISQQDIKQLLAIYGGPSAHRMIVDSLQRQTGVSMIDAASQGAIAQMCRAARKNFYLVSATANVAILLEHATTVPQAMQVAGPGTITRGFARWMANPASAAKFAWESSAYLRGRHNEIDINMRDLADDMEGKSGGLAGRADRGLAHVGLNTDLGMPFRLTQRVAMAMLQWVNHHMAAVPNWTGAYYDASEGKGSLNGVIQASMEHHEAVAFADKIVSLAHGSGAEMDMSPVQSGYGNSGLAEFFKMLNFYYSYHGNQLNLNKGALARIAQGRNAGERATGLFQFALALGATIIAGLVTQRQHEMLFGTKDKPPTTDNQLTWVQDEMANGLAAEVPLVGRPLEQMRETWFNEHRLDFNPLPLAGEVTTLARAGIDLTNAATGKPMMADAIRDLVKGAGYITGTGGAGQIGNTLQAYFDQTNPKDLHPIRGMLFGPSAEKDELPKEPSTGRGRSRGRH